MKIQLDELVGDGDVLKMKDRAPSDSLATICRLSIVEGGCVQAEIQITREMSDVLMGWLARVRNRV